MNEKILIIDKEPETLGTLETILTKKWYQIRSTTDCNEAIRIFESESFDLVIADIKMPGQDGLAFIRKLKSLDEDTEIIVLTGSPTIQNIIQAMRRNGAFDLLTKPLENLEQLFISVDQALERTRLNREKSAFIGKLRNHQPAGKKILIVDDDIYMQDLLTEILSREEYETETASSGFEAGTKVVKFKPGLVILDLIMPLMSGFEVCRMIKEDPDTSHIKILALTGYDTEENRKKIMEAGADGYMTKPVERVVLLRHVENLLKAKVAHP